MEKLTRWLVKYMLIILVGHGGLVCLCNLYVFYPYFLRFFFSSFYFFISHLISIQEKKIQNFSTYCFNQNMGECNSIEFIISLISLNIIALGGSDFQATHGVMFLKYLSMIGAGIVAVDKLKSFFYHHKLCPWIDPPLHSFKTRVLEGNEVPSWLSF